MSLKTQMYLTIGSVVLMFLLYTSIAWYNYTHPRVLPKRDKRRKHALLKALLEQKRREEAEKNNELLDKENKGTRHE